MDNEAPPAADAPREIELKLFVPPASVGRLWMQPSIATHAVGPLVVARIENRYYDTPDRVLAHAGMALRLRRIGRRWLQTLKAGGERTGALTTRGEWESEVAGPAFEWARLAGTPLATFATPAGSLRSFARRVAPLFTTNFRRESRLVRLDDGTEIEVACDVGTIATGRGARRRTLAIQEVELELKRAGTTDPGTTLLRFAARIADDLPLIPLAESKAARGYRLVDEAPRAPTKVVLPVARPGDGPRAHLARVLVACNDALLRDVHLLFEQGPASPLAGRVEAVHQARVAIRRMRSALRTFSPLLKARRVAALDDGLRAMAAAFGAVRDQDVLFETTMQRIADRVSGDAAGKEALAAFAADADQRRVASHAALFAALGAGPLGATALATLRVAHRLAAVDDAGASLVSYASPWLERQRKRVVRSGRRIAVLDPEERHALRIEVKRLRYGLDLCAGLFDAERGARFGDALADLQEKLGRLNDESVAKQLIASFPASAARDVVLERYAAWLERHVEKQLPKVAALAVAFELAPPPWSARPRRTFG